jgi:hypothetical protein
MQMLHLLSSSYPHSVQSSKQLLFVCRFIKEHKIENTSVIGSSPSATPRIQRGFISYFVLHYVTLKIPWIYGKLGVREIATAFKI